MSLRVVSLLLLSLASSGSVVAAGARRIHVVDDSNQGVPSHVSLVASDGKQVFLKDTDDAGWLSFQESCGAESKLVAVPTIDVYIEGTKPCPPAGNRIVLTKKPYWANLRANAATLETNGEFFRAALVYNEIAGRGNPFSPITAEAEKKTYMLFFRGISGSADVSSYVSDEEGRPVLSGKGKRTVVSFQKREGFKKPNGVIDYKTLAAAADSNISAYLYTSGSLGPPV